ncbi:hypothetical protein H6P81_002060 [Aristolochia fimbriata]|uniref:Uncharacterized protein n=1 Tax=Aristolochia fimbriata TaxID=158543 RepID=A0AAV7F8R2_ARIFI|nr:hypothetical protein H6P81_002060 [Aristolochia fimbriata]
MALIFRNSMLKLSHESRSGLSKMALFAATRSLSSDSRRLAGKIALITGAASGIGKTTAAEFIRNGAKVIIADVQREQGEQTAGELGPDATFFHCDVTHEPSVSSAVDFAVSKHGRLDIAHHNAGIGGSASSDILHLEMSDFDAVLRVNVRGVAAGIKHAARVMARRRSGSILCTASVSGVTGGMAPLAYTASKFAVVGMVKSAAAELGGFGIRVNCVSPFAIPTPFVMEGMSEIYPGLDAGRIREIVHGAGVLKGADCEEIDIARAAVFLASDDAKYISGLNLVVDGGFTSFKRLSFPSPSEQPK